MGKKSKVGSLAKRPTKAAKKTKAKAKEKPQRERFIEAARSIGVDESGKEFEAALKKIVPPKQGS
jgi:hypothetical protein